MLAELMPKARQAYRSLPIIGRFVGEFADWSRGRGYSVDSVKRHLQGVRRLARALQRSGCKEFKELTPEHVETAWRRVRRGDSHTRCAIRLFRRFLEKVHDFPPAALKPATRLDRELQRYRAYLGSVCGLAEQRIDARARCARSFLFFIEFNRSKSGLVRLSFHRIEAFVRLRSKTCSRSSLKQLIGRLRSFLRFQYSGGSSPALFTCSWKRLGFIGKSSCLGLCLGPKYRPLCVG